MYIVPKSMRQKQKYSIDCHRLGNCEKAFGNTHRTRKVSKN